MMESSDSDNEIGEVVLQLLDSSSGRPIKAWTFKNQAEITIGRSPDQLVDISDPYVSRSHARLDFRDGKWLLVSLGRNGVVIANQLVTEYPVELDVSFRLGKEGPTMRFRTSAEQEKIGATINSDTLPEFLFQLDEQKLQTEVGEISEGDYFQNLQARAEHMRRNRKVD